MTQRASLQARIYERLEAAPDRPALAFMDSDGSAAWRSRAELHADAAAYALGLRELGLRKGDVCLVVLPSHEFCATVVLASLLVGAVPLLIAPPMLLGMHSDLKRVLLRTIRKTGARLVVCDGLLRDLKDDLEAARPGTRYAFGQEEVPSVGGEELTRVIPAEGDIAAMQLTSGTTGFPRVCVWKQKGVVAALDGMAPAMKLTADDICFNWTPLYHDMGLVNNYFLCLAEGVPLVLLSPHEFVKRPALWLRGLSSTGATHTWSPNFGFALAASRVRDEEVGGVRLDRVRAFWNAAERIHLSTITEFHERFAHLGVRREALKTNFGCAENVGGATFSDPDGGFVWEKVESGALHEQRVAVPVEDGTDGRRAVSVVGVGRAAPGIELRILSRTGEPLPDGQIGELALETPSRMVGYLKDAGATRRAIQGDLLRTGDLGYLRDGELFWVGRVRERITIAGKKLDPSDFERILLEVGGLRPGCFAAFGLDDGARGTQRVVIVSEVRDGKPSDLGALIAQVRKSVNLGLGIETSDVVLVPKGTLTKTSSGKRRHRYFRELYESGRLERFRLGPEQEDAVPARQAGGSRGQS